MYAAAGGASLASRSRQRQRQQNNKNKALQAKLAQAKVGGAAIPKSAQQSRQFHQLPSTYLRTPQAQARKLSASYATQSKLLLPIVEGPNHQHIHHHHHHHLHHDPHGRPLSPKLGPRHERVQHLTKSATASFPLVSQAEATPPSTPVGAAIGYSKHHQADSGPNLPSQIQVPQHDAIIVTPATPMASPGHHPDAAASSGQLERKCSFYRVRRTDAFEHDDTYTTAIAPGTTITAQHQFESYTEENVVYGLPNGGSGHKWAQVTYCEQDICTCEQYECAQGRAAWLERGRRCSVQDNNPASCHRRWVKRNRIQDSSLGGSSDDEDLLGVLRGPSSFANAFLYVGLGTIAIGLVIAFVGTGEKGFKTVELRLIGPSLIGIGLICCILRICFCICPSHCISSTRRNNKKNNNKIDADHTTSLLRGESKRVSIAKGPHLQKFPLTHKKSNNKMLNEGMEALRQIATTSLFLQNEQKPTTNRVVPIIKEPEKPTEEAPLEMKKLDTTLNICDVSDDEDEEEDCAPGYSNQTECLVQSQSKLARQRMPLNQQQLQPHQHQHHQHQTDTGRAKVSEELLMETSLMVLNPPPTSSGKITIAPPPTATSTTMTTTATSLPSSSSIAQLTPPPSTSSHCYDLPPTTPHQYALRTTATSASASAAAASVATTLAEQHTPGQIVDTGQSLQLPPALTPTLTVPSPTNNATSSQSNIRTLGGLSVASPVTAVPQPPVASTSNLLQPPPPTITSEPELVLSPAKLGQ